MGFHLKDAVMMSQVSAAYPHKCVYVFRIRWCHHWLSSAIRSPVM